MDRLSKKVSHKVSEKASKQENTRIDNLSKREGKKGEMLQTGKHRQQTSEQAS